MKTKKIQGNRPQRQTVSAIVKKVKDDRILFNIHGLNAAWFVHGGKLNLHTLYKKGEEVVVNIIKQCNYRQNASRLSYIVIPELLPVDVYAQTHPIGTTTSGTIDSINGSTMSVMLAENVFCITRRCRNARTGKTVSCKIEKYNSNQRYISIRVLE